MFPSGQNSVGWNIHCVGFQDTKQPPPCWSLHRGLLHTLTNLWCFLFLFLFKASILTPKQGFITNTKRDIESHLGRTQWVQEDIWFKSLEDLSPWKLPPSLMTSESSVLLETYLNENIHKSQSMSGCFLVWVKYPKILQAKTAAVTRQTKLDIILALLCHISLY